MKRRTLGLALAGFAVAALTIGAVAVAGLQPANLSYTPNSEGQMTNIDVARAYAKNYYGAPTAVTGSGSTGTWNAPLNLDSNYANEARSVAKQGSDWLAARSNVPSKAIVLDVDDTTLTTWNYELFSNWDFNPSTNGTGHGRHGQPGQRPWVRRLLDYRPRRLAARGDDRQPGERHRCWVLEHRHGDLFRQDRPGDRRRLRDADADQYRARRLH
jgi:hypothetical protein